MRRLKRWFRTITAATATVAIGAMLGFLVPTVIADYSPDPETAPQAAAESPVARQFGDAYVSNDQDALTAIGIPAEVRQRAARFPAEFSAVDQPVHLGSYIGSGYSLHAYASRVVKTDGTEDILSWRVATGGGQILLLPPPTPIEATP
jgi:hypothetical protein